MPHAMQIKTVDKTGYVCNSVESRHTAGVGKISYTFQLLLDKWCLGSALLTCVNLFELAVSQAVSESIMQAARLIW